MKFLKSEKGKVILSLCIIITFLVCILQNHFVEFMFSVLRGIFIFSVAVIVTGAVFYLILTIADKIPDYGDE